MTLNTSPTSHQHRLSLLSATGSEADEQVSPAGTPLPAGDTFRITRRIGVLL